MLTSQNGLEETAQNSNSRVISLQEIFKRAFELKTGTESLY